VIAGGLETVLAGGVADCAPLAVGVHVTVRASSVTLSVRLFLELHTVTLRVSGTELTVVGQVPGVGQYGGVLLGGGCQRHRRQRHGDKYLKSPWVCGVRTIVTKCNITGLGRQLSSMYFEGLVSIFTSFKYHIITIRQKPYKTRFEL